jgi:SynChlorMet cassette protein ScmD
MNSNPEAAKPTANPELVLREEFDDWAVLFDPDTGRGYGLSPTGVFIWKLLDGTRTEEEIADGLKESFQEVPEDMREHVREFIEHLVSMGLVGYEIA